MLSRNLKVAIAAAKKAGFVIMASYGKVRSITAKKDLRDVVTEVDRESDKVIIDHLRANSQYAILTEESGFIGESKDFVWVVDPIDGTKNFSRGIPFFCVCIALLKDNQPVLGVTYNPVTRECFYAEKAKGAFMNGHRISVSTERRLEASVIIVNSGYAEEHRKKRSMIFESMSRSSSVRVFGSTGLELCLVANGASECFISSGDKVWDYAAGIVLVREAGGRVTDWNGKEWVNRDSFILASNGKFDMAVAEVVKKIQK